MNQEDKALLEAALELLEYISIDDLIEFTENVDEIFCARVENLEDEEGYETDKP
jgi:hypothetical protein